MGRPREVTIVEVGPRDGLQNAKHLMPTAAKKAWIGALAYTVQLYFDFSGYSDMAIGLGKMMGFRFKENFDRPYISSSLTEFWTRWHISLSTWLRDYLYIPLGGNRRGVRRTYVNLVLTMLLGGIWHGAGWTFVMWGALHGLYLCVNHAWIGWRKKRAWGAMPKPVAIALTFVAVLVGRVFFRAHDFASAGRLLASMFGLHGLGGWPDKATRVIASAEPLTLSTKPMMLAEISPARGPTASIARPNSPVASL